MPNLSAAELRGAKLTAVNLSGANPERGKNDAQTKWPESSPHACGEDV